MYGFAQLMVEIALETNTTVTIINEKRVKFTVCGGASTLLVTDNEGQGELDLIVDVIGKKRGGLAYGSMSNDLNLARYDLLPYILATDTDELLAMTDNLR